jgi:hypothetical protein
MITNQPVRTCPRPLVSTSYLLGMSPSFPTRKVCIKPGRVQSSPCGWRTCMNRWSQLTLTRGQPRSLRVSPLRRKPRTDEVAPKTRIGHYYLMGRPKTDADPVTKNDPSEIDASVKIKILLDSPSDAPTKSMKDAAAVLAKLILDSSPRFSVGVFGGWGSGKTTLMRAIHRELRRDISTIPVEFSG